MTVYAYIRVPGNRREAEPSTVEQQESLIEKYSQQQEISVNVWCRDRGVSGFLPFSQREQGSRLLNEAKSGDVIVATSFDRLFKESKDAFETLSFFQNKGVSIHIVDISTVILGTDFEKPLFSILKTLSDSKKARISKSLRETRARLSHVPYGYELSDKGSLIPNKEKLDALNLMKELRDKKLSYRDIQKILLSEKKIKLSHSGIRKILLSINN